MRFQDSYALFADSERAESVFWAYHNAGWDVTFPYASRTQRLTCLHWVRATQEDMPRIWPENAMPSPVERVAAAQIYCDPNSDVLQILAQMTDEHCGYRVFRGGRKTGPAIRAIHQAGI